MVRRRKRRDVQEPRVDDLFYGNPDATTESGETPSPGESGDELAETGDAPAPHRSPESADATMPDDMEQPATEAGPVSSPPEGPEHRDLPAAAPGGDAEGGGEPDDPSPAAEEHAYAARPDRTVHEGDGDAGAVLMRRRGRLGTAGRWARAAAIAGVAAALVYGAGSERLGAIDLADALDHGETTTGQPDQAPGVAGVTDSTIGCVGPGLVGLDDPSVREPDQGASVSAGSPPVEALPQGVPIPEGGEAALDAVPEGESGEVSERGAVATLAVTGATWVRGTALGPLAAGFAASQLGYSFEEEQWGMATAACPPAQDDLWLLGGGDEAGRVERLILVNPTGNPITVTAEVLGAAGPVDVVGGTGIVVPPAGRHVVLLDALAPGEERPVVHVTTTGGPVVAALGDRWLEGTVDRGTEVTTAAAPPATGLVIPAVPAPRPDTADLAVVRVAVPGDEAAVVRLRALTPDGPVQLEQGVTNVPAGAVVDVDVADLPEGTQGIEVGADVPVVAAAQVQRRAEPDGIGELAWLPAAAPTSGLQGAPLATAADGAITESLSMASLEGAVVEVVTVVDGVVEVRELQVPAASSRTVDLAEQTESVWVRPVSGSTSSAVVSTLEHALGTQIAGLPLPEGPVTREVRAVAPWLP